MFLSYIFDYVICWLKIFQMLPKNNIEIKSKHCGIAYTAFYDQGPCYTFNKTSLVMPECCQFLICFFSVVLFAWVPPSQLSAPNLHSLSPQYLLLVFFLREMFSDSILSYSCSLTRVLVPSISLLICSSSQTLSTLRFGDHTLHHLLKAPAVLPGI